MPAASDGDGAATMLGAAESGDGAALDRLFELLYRDPRARPAPEPTGASSRGAVQPGPHARPLGDLKLPGRSSRRRWSQPRQVFGWRPRSVAWPARRRLNARRGDQRPGASQTAAGRFQRPGRSTREQRLHARAAFHHQQYVAGISRPAGENPVHHQVGDRGLVVVEGAHRAGQRERRRAVVVG